MVATTVPLSTQPLRDSVECYRLNGSRIEQRLPLALGPTFSGTAFGDPWRQVPASPDGGGRSGQRQVVNDGARQSNSLFTRLFNMVRRSAAAGWVPDPTLDGTASSWSNVGRVERSITGVTVSRTARSW